MEGAKELLTQTAAWLVSNTHEQWDTTGTVPLQKQVHHNVETESAHGTHTVSLVEWEGPSSAGTRYCLPRVLQCWVDKLSMSHP